MTYQNEVFKAKEIWTQDHQDADLWIAENGVMVNTAALTEREEFFSVERRFVVDPYLNLRSYPSASF